MIGYKPLVSQRDYLNLDQVGECGIFSNGLRFTIRGDACPFHASVVRPTSQAGRVHESAGVGQVS